MPLHAEDDRPHTTPSRSPTCWGLRFELGPQFTEEAMQLQSSWLGVGGSWVETSQVELAVGQAAAARLVGV